MGELDTLAMAVAIGSIVIGLTHFARLIVQWKLKRIQEANNKILIESVGVLSLLLKEVANLRIDIQAQHHCKHHSVEDTEGKKDGGDGGLP